MASRLYNGTRQLFCQVLKVLLLLGLGSITSVLGVQLICLYVCGLIVLDKHQNNSRIARFLPARCHDALNRLLRVMPLSVEGLMVLLLKLAKSLGEGYLILDDVVIEKFGKVCSFVGYCYSTSRKGVVLGIHIVVVVWCSMDGRYRIPVGFVLWMPKHRYRCGENNKEYKTKIELGKELIVWVRKRGLKFAYICFDAWYGATWFMKWLNNRGIIFITEVPCDRRVLYRNKGLIRVDEVAKGLSYRWDKELEKEVSVLRVLLPDYGQKKQVRLVVTRTKTGGAKGTKEGSKAKARGKKSIPEGGKESQEDKYKYKYEYIVTNELDARGRKVVRRKQSRWKIETVFRDEKQYGGLCACQCRVEEAMRRHVALSLLTLVVLQWLRKRAKEPVGRVKERWQLELIRQGDSVPEPLRGKQKITLEVTA